MRFCTALLFCHRFYFSIKITAYTSKNGLPIQNPTVVSLQSYNTSCQITVTFMIKWPVEMFQWPPAGIVSHVTWKKCIVAIATPFSLDVHGFVENIGFGPIPIDIVNVGIFPHECFLPENHCFWRQDTKKNIHQKLSIHLHPFEVSLFLLYRIYPLHPGEGPEFNGMGGVVGSRCAWTWPKIS